MRSLFFTFYRGYGHLLTAIALVAGIALLAVMFLVDANALSRKLFNAPIAGTLEITEAVMPLVILLPLGFTQMKRGHIRVLLLISGLSMSVQRVIGVLTLIVGFAFMIWVTWATWGAAEQSFRIGESAWGSVRFPIWPAKIGIAVGAILLAIQFLLDLVRLWAFHDDPELTEGTVVHE